jgi:hypothetical protein
MEQSIMRFEAKFSGAKPLDYEEMSQSLWFLLQTGASIDQMMKV